jgi:hypothetical protein
MFQVEQEKDRQVSRKAEGIARMIVRVIAGLNARLNNRVIDVMTALNPSQNLTPGKPERRNEKESDFQTINSEIMETPIKSVYLSLLKRLLIFSLIPGSIATILYFSLPAKFITPTLPFLFIFFIAVTLISAYILIRSSQKKFIKYLNVYLLTTVLKLFLFTAVIITYVLFNKADLIPFTLSFFILYLCYTIFEVVWLVSFSKTGQS